MPIRWYRLIGLVLCLVPVGYLLTLLGVQIWVLPRITMGTNWWTVQALRRASRVQNIFWWATISSFIIGYIWMWWFCPFLEAGDRMLARRMPLPKRLRVLRVELWAPAITFTIGGILIINRMFLADRTARSAGLVFLASGAVSAVIAAVLFKPVSARLTRAFNAGPCCSKCGYDLRGNPEGVTCPECGAEVRI
jgi:hypothetical protein